MDRDTDFFTLFSLPSRYALDEMALNDAYRALLAQVHPDSAVLADAATKLRAIEDAAYVNDAYRVLKDPVRRGEYLLQCHGETALGANEVLPAAFLNEQLDVREAADEAWHAGDTDRLESLQTHALANQRLHQMALSALFPDEETPSAEALAKARQHVVSLQFLARFVDSLDEKLD